MNSRVFGGLQQRLFGTRADELIIDSERFNNHGFDGRLGDWVAGWLGIGAACPEGFGVAG